MPVDHAISARDLARMAQQVPALPLTFQRIQELVSNPRSTNNQLAEAVGADQGLTTRILRLANSSFYGLAARVDTISQAVALIGTRQVRDLALATAVVDVFKDIPAGALDGHGFWEHSLAVGSASRLIAAKRHERETERYFVAGLLHDIGLVVMASQMPERVAVNLLSAREAQQPLTVIERRELGFDHAEVGGMVIEHWCLPPAMSEVATHHHHLLTSARHLHDCATIHLADVLVDALAYGSSGEPVVTPLDPPAWELLGLTATDLTPITSDLERQMVEVTAIFLG
ncbi:MAG TPA: HDOD domain-containing protein [Planctomycetota bacterium]|nr:HDOD domain-containing protein [Planctomycetota bacterium]